MTTRKEHALYKPILRAYGFAYLSTSGPRVVALAISLLQGKLSIPDALIKALKTIRQSAGIDRYPACAALVVAGSILGPRALARALDEVLRRQSGEQRSARRLHKDPAVQFLAAFLSALGTFKLLNLRESRPIPLTYSYIESDEQSFAAAQRRLAAAASASASRMRRSSSVVSFGSVGPVEASELPPLAGRTMDLTTFGVVHASIILACVALQTHRARQPEGRISSALTTTLEKLAAPGTFIVSSAIIMWAWFYFPDRLPRSYNSWITRAAELDPRILEALRQCRYGNFTYGKNTGLAPLLGSLARELKMPERWGDPATAVPIPCTLYHCGAGTACEWHALRRFWQGFRFALRMYLPLNLLMLLRKPAAKRFPGRAARTAAQSSAFLGAFIALFYYGVCLGRRRVGPRVLGTDVVSRQMLDGGLAVGAGCLVCGWSILAEMESRRMEMGIFVAPRALSSLLPRRYDRKYMWREQLVHALSAATIVTAAQRQPDLVKGVFGGFLQQVLA